MGRQHNRAEPPARIRGKPFRRKLSPLRPTPPKSAQREGFGSGRWTKRHLPEPVRRIRGKWLALALKLDNLRKRLARNFGRRLLLPFLGVGSSACRITW